jgi:hypothetical protein
LRNASAGGAGKKINEKSLADLYWQRHYSCLAKIPFSMKDFLKESQWVADLCNKRPLTVSYIPHTMFAKGCPVNIRVFSNLKPPP